MKKFLLSGILALCSVSVMNGQTLLANYPMDGSAVDVSGNSNNGTINGAVFPVNDRFGNASSALFFNGGNISTSFYGVSGNGSRTISFWAKVDPASNGGSPFGYGGGPTGGDFANNFSPSSGGWYFDVSNSAGVLPCRINDGAWHQYIITYDNGISVSTTGCRFYRDGTELNNLTGPYNWGGEAINTYSSVPLGMGMGIMSMDDFKMLAGAYTRAQVDSIYKAEAAFNSCLVGKYDFNSNGTDYSPQGNNAQLVSATPDYDRFFNSGGAYSFGGTPGTTGGPCTPVQISDAPLPSGNSPRTLSAWIKTTDATNDQVILDYGSLTGGQRCALMVVGGNFLFREEGVDMPGGFVADGSWHHVMFNFDGTSGTVLTDNIGTNSGPLALNTTSTSYLKIGQTVVNGSSQTECFNGSIDDIRIFNCSLSTGQMDSLYQLEKTCNTTVSIGSVTNVSCYGGSTGGGTASVTNGVAPYIYSWAPMGQTTQTVSDLYAGTHTLTVTDNGGCVATTTVSIGEPSQLYASLSAVTHATCFNLCNGNATMGASGGTPPYSFQWDALAASQTTAMATALCGANTYNCVVTDINGCTSSDYALINNPNPVDGTINETASITCPSACDGTLDVTPSGGTGTYTSFLWQPGSIATQTATGLCSGSYTLTIMDDNGCSGTVAAYMLNEPMPLSVAFVPTSPSCFGASDGTLDAQTTGGTGGYTFFWSAGAQTSQMATGLSAGNYTVTVTDGNGCSTSPFGTLADPAALTLGVSSTNITCYGAYDGTATAIPGGGTPPYYYYWTSGSYDSLETNVGPSNPEIVTVYDALGCMIRDSVIITEPLQIDPSLSCTQASCGASTGSITISVTGGVAPLTYLWNTGATTANISSLFADNYFLQIYDANGCYGSASIIITDANGPVVALNSVTDLSCSGKRNGAIDIGISGGTAPYTIEWSNGQLTEDIDSLMGGDYDVVVHDVNGCVSTSSFSVIEPDMLSMDGTYTPSSCGLLDGNATCNVYGGTSPYTYAWDASAGFQTSATATGLGSGNYKVIVTDNNGCMDSLYLSMSDANGPIVDIDSSQQAGCVLNGGNGAIYTTAYGTPGPYAYQWTNGATTDDITSLGIGIFGLTVTDQSSGCKTSIAKRIQGQRPGTAQICLASVDTMTNHNLIIWNDTVQGIAWYEIFRETSTQGNYNSIALIQAGNGNTFEDTLANVDRRPWRYKIKATDSCDIASIYSVQ
ncbi:MAG: LamG-like jellyroll fold domain-containing protein, partial [Bacteroidia bacterium]